VLIRDRLRQVAPPALLGTDRLVEPTQILAWFVWRWPLEVTQAAGRRHRGVATQRPWSAVASRRTTPARLGLGAVVTLRAQPQLTAQPPPGRPAAWYRQRAPTVADARALVRRALWCHPAQFCRSHRDPDLVTVPRVFVERLSEALCYAA
jgi:hypothetical protein